MAVYRREVDGITYNYTSTEESWRVIDLRNGEGEMFLSNGQTSTINDLYTFKTEYKAQEKVNQLGIIIINRE